MERLLLLLFIGLTLLGLTTYSANADELDFFEEFSEEFENKVDIEIDSLDFIRPESGVGNAGTFKFKKFHVQNPRFSIFVGNEDSLFDSNVYIKGSHVGIKGPLTRFSYKLDEMNTEYLHSFKWANVKSTSLLMNKEEINLSGLYYQIRKPETVLLLENFVWNCDRHSDYLENDANGFLAGCLNSASILPLNKDNLIDVSFTFLGPDEKEEDKLEFNSRIKSISLGAERVTGETEISSMTFGNGTHLVASKMLANCGKPVDLIEINSANLLIPCLNDFVMESELFGIYFKDNADESFNFEKPKIQVTEDSLKLENKMFKYDSPTAKLKLLNVQMKSNKVGDFKELDYDSYLLSLYNASTFYPSKGFQTTTLDYSIINPEAGLDETKVLNIRSDIKEFKSDQNKIYATASKLLLKQDEEYFYHLNGTSLECAKESNILDFNSDKVLADCKNNGTYKFRDILIDNQKDDKKPKYFLKPEYIKVEDGFLSLLASGFQIVDEKENLTLLNASLKCKKDYDKDLFEILDIIENCFQDSKAYIGRIVSEKNKKRDQTKGIYQLYKRMLEGKVANPINLVRTKDAFVRDVKVQIKDNWLAVDLEIKFLAGDIKVKAEGSIVLDRESETIIIDIKKAKLPLTKSKKILMYFLKKNMANETVVFEDGKILIKL